MDTNSTLIIVNLLLNFMQVMDHFLSKIKKSRCFGNELEMIDNNNKKNNTNSSFDNFKKEIYEMIQINNKNIENKDKNKDDNILDKV